MASTLAPLSLSPAQKTTYKKLLQAAVEARENAYAPNSGSMVGAAVLGASGEIYQGANFEFTRYADHAEQVAINQAIANGEKSIEAVATFVAPRGPVEEKHFHGNSCPCGNCRQALFEVNPSMTTVMFDGPNDVKGYLLSDMLPAAYKRQWPEAGEAPLVENHPDPLVQQALLARSRSLAVRSGYPEGAAVETESGQIYKGVKVELSSFASQAERMAAASAFLKGDRKIVRVSIVGGSGKPETPKDINWDSMQALYKQNPDIKIVHPNAQGEFQQQSFPAFLADHLLTVPR